jgi:hypothetical protein
MNAGRLAKGHVTDPNGEDLRHPGAGVVEQGQQQPIALADDGCCRNVPGVCSRDGNPSIGQSKRFTPASSSRSVISRSV